MATTSFVQLIERLQETVAVDGPFWLLVKAICYISALYFGYLATMQIKEVAENQRHGYKAPIFTFIAAICFATSPALINAFLNTIYGASSVAAGGLGITPLYYIKDPEGANKSVAAVFTLVSFIGYVFFVRGIFILREAGEPQKYQQSTVTRALITMGAGVMAIYIDFTLIFLAGTFGFDISSMLDVTFAG